jgi:hypothetical protein
MESSYGWHSYALINELSSKIGERGVATLPASAHLTDIIAINIERDRLVNNSRCLILQIDS